MSDQQMATEDEYWVKGIIPQANIEAQDDTRITEEHEYMSKSNIDSPARADGDTVMKISSLKSEFRNKC